MYVFKLLAISYFFIKYSLKMDFLQKMSIPRHSTEHFILGSYVHLLGEFKHEVRQFEKSYDNQQAEQISLMV